jgi:transcriptional regulator with XRE-family HTH domain
MNMREFGVRLTRAREQRRLSITQLARQMGVDYMQISRYEKGQSLPSFETAIRLANALQVSLDLLVSAREIPEPPPSFKSTRVLARMRELDELPEHRQDLALRFLDAVIAGELDGLVSRLRRD